LSNEFRILSGAVGKVLRKGGEVIVGILRWVALCPLSLSLTNYGLSGCLARRVWKDISLCSNGNEIKRARSC